MQFNIYLILSIQKDLEETILNDESTNKMLDGLSSIYINPKSRAKDNEKQNFYTIGMLISLLQSIPFMHLTKEAIAYLARAETLFLETFPLILDTNRDYQTCCMSFFNFLQYFSNLKSLFLGTDDYSEFYRIQKNIVGKFYGVIVSGNALIFDQQIAKPNTYDESFDFPTLDTPKKSIQINPYLAEVVIQFAERTKKN